MTDIDRANFFLTRSTLVFEGTIAIPAEFRQYRRTELPERDDYSRVSKRGCLGKNWYFGNPHESSTFRRNNALFVGKERTRGNWRNVAVTEAREGG